MLNKEPKLNGLQNYNRMSNNKILTYSFEQFIKLDPVEQFELTGMSVLLKAYTNHSKANLLKLQKQCFDFMFNYHKKSQNAV